MLRADRNISVETHVETEVVETGIQVVEPKVYEPEVVDRRKARYPQVGVFKQLVGDAYSELDEATLEAYRTLGVQPPKPKYPMYYLTLNAGKLKEKTPDGEFHRYDEYLAQIVASARLYKLWGKEEEQGQVWKLAFKPKTDAELHQLLVEQYGFDPAVARKYTTKDVSFCREIGLRVLDADGNEVKKCILSVSSSSAGRYEEYVRRLLSKGLVYQDVLTKLKGDMYFDPVKGNAYPVVNFEALDINTGQPLGVDTYDMNEEQATRGSKGAKGKKKQ